MDEKEEKAPRSSSYILSAFNMERRMGKRAQKPLVLHSVNSKGYGPPSYPCHGTRNSPYRWYSMQGSPRQTKPSRQHRSTSRNRRPSFKTSAANLSAK